MVSNNGSSFFLLHGQPNILCEEFPPQIEMNRYLNLAILSEHTLCSSLLCDLPINPYEFIGLCLINLVLNRFGLHGIIHAWQIWNKIIYVVYGIVM